MGEPLVIGVGGLAGAGKDTIADYLVSQHGFSRTSYADPIKYALESMGVEGRYLYREKETIIPGLGVSARHLMQSLGTDWGRNMIDADFWCRVMTNRVERLRQDGVTRIVIPDVRFQNEAAWVRSAGILWHVSRPKPATVRPHVSEQGISPLPGEPLFRNDGDLEDLFDRVAIWIAGHPALAERLR
jgi:hypothetical protein